MIIATNAEMFMAKGIYFEPWIYAFWNQAFLVL